MEIALFGNADATTMLGFLDVTARVLGAFC